MFVPSMEKTIDDITRPELQDFLKNLQGNILKSHGRTHTAVLIISFGPNDPSAQPLAAKAWIRAMAAPENNRITSAHEQIKQKETKTETFQTLALSSRGYEFLSTRRPTDGAFRDGMQKRRSILNDPRVSAWETDYQRDPGEIHALLQIANDQRAPVDTEVNKVKAELALFGGRVLVEERGEQIWDANEEAVEHFGYRDGVSQPLFIRDVKTLQKPEFDPHAPLKLVLATDPSGSQRFGSYLVFRKLEQNPKKFDEGIKAIVATPGMDVTEELAGAMTIGRFKDGTPVVRFDTPQGNDGDKIDFNYSGDDDGQKCPFAGHVRKVNPRGEIPFLINLLAREQVRRITRRGITYGGPRPAGAPLPTGGVGLLFMCYQNDIADQFEFIQDTWANNRDFRKSHVGLDPIIGQTENNPRQSDEWPRWPAQWGKGTKQHVQTGDYVRLRGGEYFFVPSMATLRTI